MKANYLVCYDITHPRRLSKVHRFLRGRGIHLQYSVFYCKLTWPELQKIKSMAAKIIANQVMQSIGSVSANIAEGYGRRRGKEYEHYLYIARGSANESLDWYEKLKRLGYIKEAIFNKREAVCNELRAMLTGMINKI